MQSQDNPPGPHGPQHIYQQDGLRSVHNHEFMDDPKFQSAYQRGIKAAGGRDYNWHWRVHVGLWAARVANGLRGDFVECGVGRGFLSSAIMQDLDWNNQRRTFYLLDTFSGIDPRYATEAEAAKHLDRKPTYAESVDEVRANFSEWDRVKIIQGPVPETLRQIETRSIAYLHLDMNCTPPEIAAISELWDRLVPGAPILLDDYAYRGYREQKLAMDNFARSVGAAVLSVPTGQGVMIRTG